MNWIKINSEKDLPPVDDDGLSDVVVGCIEHNDKGSSFAMYLNNGIWHYLESKNPVSDEFNVTYWHPFLDPPETEKQKQKRLIIEIMQADEKDGLYDA